MVPQPRWLRALALAAATAVLSSLAVAQPTAAQADTAPASTSTPTTVSSDSLPTTQVNGVVWSQIIVGNTVYVGGDFTQAQPAGAAAGVNTVARSDMLAYDLTTGMLNTSFAPTFNAQVRGLAASPDGKTIYATGNFTQVSGVTRYRVVALDAATGAVKANFAPALNAAGYTVAATASTVYVGGAFSIANSATRTRAASFDAVTGGLKGWAPNIPDHIVRALVLSPDASKVVLGGSFLSLNGSTSPGRGLGAVDATTGANMDWNVGRLISDAGDSASIYSLWSDGTNVYGSGYVFGGPADGNLEGAFNATWADGTINWIEDCHGDSYSVASLGDAVYTVSHDHYCGNVPGGFYQTDPSSSAAKKQYSLAFSKDVEGTLAHDHYGDPYVDFGGQPAPRLLTWYPDLAAGTYTGLSQAAWSVTTSNGYVLLGGEFPSVNGKRQTGLARFAVRSKAPNTDGPRLSGANWTPSAVSLSSGSVRVSWPSNWDRDNANLTYTVYRNGGTTPVYTTTAESEGYWVRPQLGFVDTGLTPGATASYKVRATDPLGNVVTGSTVSATVSGSADSSYSKAVVADGAAHYWRLGEAAGSSVYDWAGYDDMTAGPGVTRGAAGAVVNDSNTASTFSGDGTGLAATSNLVPGPQAFSLETWFRTTSTAGGKIVGFGNTNTGDSSSYDRHLYMDGSGAINFGVYPGFAATLQSSPGYNDGQWHQAVASLGSNGMQLFLDGKRVGSRGDVTSAQQYDGYWRVGGDSSWGGANYFTGDIDDVAVYPTALGATTVKNHWIASGHGTATVAPTDKYGAAVFGDGPDSYWRLGDAAGSTTASDRTGNDVTASVNPGVTLGAAGGITGTTDTAATFDGGNGLVVSNQYVSDPEVYSLELWFNTTTTSGGKLIGFGDNTSGESNNYDRHVWMHDDGTLEFGTWTGQANTVHSTKSFNDGAWHQVIATQGPNGLNLVIDGASVGTNPATQAQPYGGYWRLGGDRTWGGASSDFFAGTIDDVAIYSSVLSDSQIANHYGLGKGATANTPPTAKFTASATNLSVAFDGSASSDMDGTVASYAWDFGDGQTGTGATPTHVYTATGAYQVTLTVTDDKGAKGSTANTVTATAANKPPTASFSAASNGLTASVDASASSDPDGTIASYAWKFGDGGTATGATTSHTYATGGTYTVTLTVTDDSGATDSTTRSVSVAAANQPPVASFTKSVSGLTASVDGSGSSDPNGTVTSYAWTFGDGGTATGATASHTYAAGGTYTVKLTVTDDAGATAGMSSTVTVTAPSATTVARDAFGRSVSGGLGTADVGGPWTTSGTSTDFSVASGTAGFGTAAGQTRSAYLGNVSTASADVSSTVGLSTLPVGGNAYLGVVGRRVGSEDYNARVIVSPSGGVTLEIVRDGTSLKAVVVSGLSYMIGTKLRLRLQVDGTSPTVLRARVWRTTDTEPTTWQATASDTTTVLQGPGAIGLRSYLSGGVTNGKASILFGDLAAQTLGTSAPNAAPTAAFTSNASGLAATFDGSTSSDSDGSVKAWAWDFGDSVTGTGSTVNHTFAAAGTYSVTLTVTDDQGAKATTSKQVTVTAATSARLAADAFGRTTTGGLGTADTGGAWTVSGGSANFSVGSGAASLRTSNGTTLTGLLGSVSAADTDVSVTVTVPAIPAGGNLYAGIVGRRVGTDDYNGRMMVAPSGAVSLLVLHGGTSLRTTTVSGITATAGTVLHLRLRTTGRGTTTLQARAWLDGSVQPSTWQATATDTTAALQASGSIGVSTYLSSAATNGPLAVGFDDFVADPAA